VIRFQKRNFDIFATISQLSYSSPFQLWFAFKKGTLIYLQQSKLQNLKVKYSCDSLSKKELWYTCNNKRNFKQYKYNVVIRFQKRNFDIFATMLYLRYPRKIALWFAFKKGTLIYLQQYMLLKKITLTSCDSLSKKELWYICNNFEFIETSQFGVLWFAFKKGTLIYLQQFFIVFG